MKRVDITAQLTHVPNDHPYKELCIYAACLLLSKRQNMKDRRARNYMVLFIYLLTYLCFI